VNPDAVYLGLAGYWGDPATLPDLLPGFIPEGADYRPVPYYNWSPSVVWAGQVDGPIRLNAAIQAVHAAEPNRPIVVVGHSFGAVVEDAYLNQYAPTSNIPAELIQFVCAGDSTGQNGSYTWLYGMPPATTRHRVTRVVKQYDTHADKPNRTTSPYYGAAIDNCNVGDGYPHHLHLAYQECSPSAPHTEIVVGNTVHMLFPTAPVITRDSWGRPVTREQIEDAYDRIG
jgi:hypothetical protein